MANDEKLEEIRRILTDEYGGEMSEEDIDGLAEDLHFSVFECGFSLDDIFTTVYKYEEEANIECSRGFYVFCCIIDLLENGEETAEILYDCFMYHWDILEIFLKLYYENDEYISEEKLQKAKEKALQVFDKEILRFCGVI